MTILHIGKRRIVMTFLHISRAVLRLEMEKPTRCRDGSEISVDREPREGQAVTRTASRHAAQKTKKKHARNTGKLAPADHCSTARPIR